MFFWWIKLDGVWSGTSVGVLVYCHHRLFNSDSMSSISISGWTLGLRRSSMFLRLCINFLLLQGRNTWWAGTSTSPISADYKVRAPLPWLHHLQRFFEIGSFNLVCGIQVLVDGGCSTIWPSACTFIWMQMLCLCHEKPLYSAALTLVHCMRRIISLMSKLGIVGSTVAQQILLLSVSTFGAGNTCPF